MPTPEEIAAEEERKKAEEQKNQQSPNQFTAFLQKLLSWFGLDGLLSGPQTQSDASPAPSGLKPASVAGQEPAGAPKQSTQQKAEPEQKSEAPAKLKQATVAEKKPVEPLKVHTYKGDLTALKEVEQWHKGLQEHRQASDEVSRKVAALPDPYFDGTYDRAVETMGRGHSVDAQGHDSVARLMIERQKANAQTGQVMEAALPAIPATPHGDTFRAAKFAAASQDVQFPELTADKIFKHGSEGNRIDLPTITSGKDKDGNDIKLNIANVVVTHYPGDRFVVAVVPINLEAAANKKEKGYFAVVETEMTRAQAEQRGLINSESSPNNTIKVTYVEKDKATAGQPLELSATSAGGGFYNKGLTMKVNDIGQADFAKIEEEKRKVAKAQHDKEAAAKKLLADQRRAELHRQQEKSHGMQRTSNRGGSSGAHGVIRTDNSSRHPVAGHDFAGNFYPSGGSSGVQRTRNR